MKERAKTKFIVHFDSCGVHFVKICYAYLKLQVESSCLQTFPGAYNIVVTEA